MLYHLGAAAISASGNVRAIVLNGDGCSIDSEIFPIISYPSSSAPLIPSQNFDAEYVLVFTATEIPALSSKAYAIKLQSDSTLTVMTNTNLNANQRWTAKGQEALEQTFSIDKTMGEEDKVKKPKSSAQLIKEEFLVASNSNSNVESPMAADFTVTNGIVTLEFDERTGFMKSITRVIDDVDPKNPKKKEIKIDVSNSLSYYKSFGSPGLPGYVAPPEDDRDPHLKNIKPLREVSESVDGSFSEEESTQPSGAYIFRPSEVDERPTLIGKDEKVQLTVIRGGQVIEVHQRFSDWAVTIVRLTGGSAAVEFEYRVGPIPLLDGIGKEVVSSFTSNLESEGKMYTDSNGREFQERKRNFRQSWDVEISEPVAGNYYPVTVAAYIRDEKLGVQMTVLTDRAHGVASVIDGEMEFMLHRRLIADDNRGVDEPLNETQGGMDPYPSWTRKGEGIIVSAKHQLLLSPIDVGMTEMREKIDQVYSPLQLFYGKKNRGIIDNFNRNVLNEEINTGFNDPDLRIAESSLKLYEVQPPLDDLPVNIHLLTFEKTAKDSYLIRLAHQFAVNEDSLLSSDVDINLSKTFKNLGIKNMVEMSLSANQLRSEMLARKIYWNSTVTGTVTNEIDQKKHIYSSKDLTQDEYPTDVDGEFLITLKPMQIRTFIVKTT